MAYTFADAYRDSHASTPPLTCPKCGSETNPEYRIDKLGDRYPVWQCLNIDCLHLEK